MSPPGHMLHLTPDPLMSPLKTLLFKFLSVAPPGQVAFRRISPPLCRLFSYINPLLYTLLPYVASPYHGPMSPFALCRHAHYAAFCRMSPHRAAPIAPFALCHPPLCCILPLYRPFCSLQPNVTSLLCCVLSSSVIFLCRLSHYGAVVFYLMFPLLCCVLP